MKLLTESIFVGIVWLVITIRHGTAQATSPKSPPQTPGSSGSARQPPTAAPRRGSKPPGTDSPKDPSKTPSPKTPSPKDPSSKTPSPKTSGRQASTEVASYSPSSKQSPKDSPKTTDNDEAKPGHSPPKRTESGENDTGSPKDPDSSIATSPFPTFEVIFDVQAKNAGDLNLKRGSLVQILETRSDGWWKAKKSDGKEGMVPMNALQPPSNYTEICEPAEEPEEPEPDSEPDLTGKKEPDSEIQKQPEKPEPTPKASASAVAESHAELQKLPLFSSPTLKSLPKGVVDSKLTNMHKSDVHVSLACHLNPKLSESNLGFHDLYWNEQDEKPLKRRIRVSKCFRLMKCENMPSPTINEKDFKITGYYAKMCLFDGHQVLSNVHTVTATVNLTKPKTWSFSEKFVDTKTIVEHSEFFVRSNYLKSNVVLLFELGVSYTKVTDSGALTYGWVTLPIFNETSAAASTPKTQTKLIRSISKEDELNSQDCVENRKHELTLRQGSPFDPTNYGKQQAPANQSPKNLPKLTFRAYAVEKSMTEFVDSLPDQLIWSTQLAQFAFFYRYIAGRTLIRDRLDTQSAELIAEPFLATFPKVADQPDLMDVLRWTWGDRIKGMKKDDVKKMTVDQQANEFRKIFMDTAFVIHTTVIMPKYDVNDPDVLMTRKEIIDSFLASYRKSKSSQDWLIGKDVTYTVKPLNIFDLALNLMNEHAID